MRVEDNELIMETAPTERSPPPRFATDDTVRLAAVGHKMDIVFMLLRTAMANGEWVSVKKLLHKDPAQRRSRIVGVHTKISPP